MMKKIITVILGMLYASSVLATTPTITTVNGTVSMGQTLVIQGTHLVDEDKSNWASFFTTHPNASGFEGASYTADGYGDTGAGNVFPNFLATYDTNIKLMGNQSILYHVAGMASQLHSYVTYPNGAASDIWVRVYVRYEHSAARPSGSALKMLDTFGGIKQQYIQPTVTFTKWMLTNHASFDINNTIPTTTNPDVVYYTLPSGDIQQDKWYEIEIHFKNGSAPYRYDVWIDGKQVVWGPTLTDAGGPSQIQMGFINVTNSGEPTFWADNWWDGFAVSSSRIYPASTVEISNNSTYGSGTLVYQEPLYLSDGSVQIKADLTGLGAGPYYLWVTNNRQERSTTYSLSGVQLKTPNAPTNLR